MTSVDDPKQLLAIFDPRIASLRRALAHDHRDATFWSAFGMDAPTTQRRRALYRDIANFVHVQRATARERLHGTRFASLDEQRAWLASRIMRHETLVREWL